MDSGDAPSIDRLATLVADGEHDRAVEWLERTGTWDADGRKRVLRTLRTLADEQPAAVDSLVPALTVFLEDDERSVRLATAKLLVTLADAEPGAVEPLVPSLADRLADGEEFYYVRARCAEALGYVALEHPDAVESPEILADLRVGLSFAEPEVRQKLAKALECVALGNPDRLRHQVSTLADHLVDDMASDSTTDNVSDEKRLIRYHLATALVAVGAENPDRLTKARTALVDALDHECEYVRGRAAEALGLLARAVPTESVDAETLRVATTADADAFLAERVQFALDAERETDTAADLGTVDSVRETTADAVEAITSPGRECPHCGLGVPEDGPPVCPGCGAPY